MERTTEQPQPTDLVHVIVSTKPNKVWAICNDQIHFAKWRTSGTGELQNVQGNAGLLHAAMLAWDGHQQHFSLDFASLEKQSAGWGAWD